MGLGLNALRRGASRRIKPPKNDAKWNVYNERHSRSTRRNKKPRGQTRMWLGTTRLAKFHHTKQKTPLMTSTRENNKKAHLLFS